MRGKYPVFYYILFPKTGGYFLHALTVHIRPHLVARLCLLYAERIITVGHWPLSIPNVAMAVRFALVLDKIAY